MVETTTLVPSTTTSPATSTTSEPVRRDVTITLAVEVLPPADAAGLRAWFLDRLALVESILAGMLGVPAEDITANIGERRLLEAAAAHSAGTAIPLALAVIFRGTVASDQELRDRMLRTVYGSSFMGGNGTGAFYGDGLIRALALELRARGETVPAGLAQATLVGSGAVVVVASGTTTTGLGNETTVPEPQEPPASAGGSTTAMVMASAIGVASFAAAGLCSVWCWRKSRLVTRGQEDVAGIHADFLIIRPECRQGSILGRSFTLASRERTPEAAKTVISWQYDQDELLRRHASFHLRQPSELSHSPEDVVLDVAPPTVEETNGGGPSLFFPAYHNGAAVEYYSRTHGRWAAGEVTRARALPQSGGLFFDVQVGKQLRTEVTMACLRPVLTENMPVFACFQQRTQSQGSWSPTRRRGPGTERKSQVWRRAVILGPQKTFATRVGYQVRIEEDDSRHCGQLLQLPPHQLRRRFPAGSSVEVYRGPRVGWVPVAVHAAALGAVAPVRSDRSTAVDARASLRSRGGSSELLDAGFASFESRDLSLDSFREDLSPKAKEKYKEREEEGQLVPIVREGREEPEWVPGFLVRHSVKESLRSDFI